MNRVESRLRYLLLCAFVLGVSAANVSEASARCPYLPEFKRLKSTLHRLSPAQAIEKLERYENTHENPAACEGLEVDLLLDLYTRKGVRLSGAHLSRPPDTSFRCSSYDKTTAICKGSVLDTTALPASSGVRLSQKQDHAVDHLRINVAFKDWKLISAYQGAWPIMQEGKAVSLLAVKPDDLGFSLAKPVDGNALIVFYETTGARKYRKLVWYF